MRTLLQPLLLAIALLFAQLGVLTHGITHTLTEQSQDQSLPHDTQCELCIAYAQLGSAVGSNDICFDFTAPFYNRYEQASHDAHALTLAAFAARAPPHSA